jgi:hypothetical protein
MMPGTKFSIAREDPEMRELLAETDQRTLAIWAIDCAERVMPYFEETYPDDARPRQALETLQEWIDTGEFSMSVIRGASLNSHAAARDVGRDDAARSAARAAGQAVATAHVPTHAYGPAIYGQQAIFRDTGSLEAADKERAWQLARLMELRSREAGTASR